MSDQMKKKFEQREKTIAQAILMNLQNYQILVFFFFSLTNATLKLKSIKQGIIQNLTLLQKAHSSKTYLDIWKWKSLHKLIDLMIHVAQLAIVCKNDGSESKIINCFAKAGFNVWKEIEEQHVFTQIQQS